MKRKHWIILGIFVALTIGVKLWQYRTPSGTMQLKGVPMNLLIADTPLLRYRGLGGREQLAPYDGMLFSFPESGRHGIVMRDMEFSIDVVWLRAGAVVDIAPELPLQPGAAETELHGYFPRTDADMVLELPAGWAKAHDLNIGDRLAGS